MRLGGVKRSSIYISPHLHNGLVLHIGELCLRGTQWLAHRWPASEGYHEVGGAGLLSSGGNFLSSNTWVLLCYTIMFIFIITLVLNAKGAEGAVLSQIPWVRGTGGEPGASFCGTECTNLQLFRAGLASLCWEVLSVPYSCWPRSENCVSSLWWAVSDQCSGGEIVRLSFLLVRKVMDTCSLIEHIGYKITSMNILLTQASLGLLCWWTWSY